MYSFVASAAPRVISTRGVDVSTTPAVAQKLLAAHVVRLAGVADPKLVGSCFGLARLFRSMGNRGRGRVTEQPRLHRVCLLPQPQPRLASRPSRHPETHAKTPCVPRCARLSAKRPYQPKRRGPSTARTAEKCG